MARKPAPRLARGEAIPSGWPILVSVEAQVAALWGLSRRTLQTWKALPGCPLGRHGPYDPVAAAPWLRARLEAATAGAEGAGDGGGGTLSDRARARRLNALAALAERQAASPLFPVGGEACSPGGYVEVKCTTDPPGVTARQDPPARKARRPRRRGKGRA